MPYGIRGEQRRKNPIYILFQGMNNRCRNVNNKDYNSYGGRGIRVCKEWEGPEGFQCFLLEMGPRPEGTSLDRIDNNGNYCKINCRWGTKHHQHGNTRRNNDTVGVFYYKNRRIAKLVIEGRNVLRKQFRTQEEAILSRKTAELKYDIYNSNKA